MNAPPNNISGSSPQAMGSFLETRCTTKDGQGQTMGGTVAERQEQALVALPGLRPLLQSRHKFRLSILSVDEAIAQGAPLIPAIRRAAGVQAWVVRLLRKQELAAISPDHLVLLLRLVNRIPPEKAPSGSQWQAAAHMLGILDSLPAGFENKLRWFREAAQGGWTEFLGGVAGNAVIEYVTALGTYVSRLTNIEYLTEPAHVAVEKTVTELLAKFSLRKLVGQATRWNRRLQASHAENRLFWPPLIPGSKEELSCGFMAVSLCSSHELRTESKSLEHCVDTYGLRCYAGISHVVSLRNRSQPCSTAELQVSSSAAGISVHVAQHKGYRNAHPTFACNEALAELTKFLQDANAQPWLRHVLADATRRRPEAIRIAENGNAAAALFGQGPSCAALEEEIRELLDFHLENETCFYRFYLKKHEELFASAANELDLDICGEASESVYGMEMSRMWSRHFERIDNHESL